jgi:uncharacterized protein YcbK (DUF882 family)
MPDNVLENVKELALSLQVLRDKVGVAFTPNSAYRCVYHNRSIGSNDSSQHVLGKAADIAIKGKIPEQTVNLIELLIENKEIPEGGLGVYNTFTHYDIRGTKARWDYRK